jgi:hypothetical protein
MSGFRLFCVFMIILRWEESFSFRDEVNPEFPGKPCSVPGSLEQFRVGFRKLLFRERVVTKVAAGYVFQHTGHDRSTACHADRRRIITDIPHSKFGNSGCCHPLIMTCIICIPVVRNYI